MTAAHDRELRSAMTALPRHDKRVIASLKLRSSKVIPSSA
jgi:hypothetical protein